MKTKWVLPALVAVVLFLWTARENFEDTATVHGPPYGNTAPAARQIILMMSPELLVSIKKLLRVTSEPLIDADAMKIVYGNGATTSPISKVMSDFYWQVYKPATSTITVAQVNTFLGLQDDTWIKANRANLREFLTAYFIRGQNGAAQSGYLDALNTVWGQLQINKANTPDEKKPVEKETTETKTTPATSNMIMFISIGIAAVSIVAVLIVMFLPPRNVL